MGGFYGYSPENFMPDTSIWTKLGGIANETLQKLPETIELEKAYEEGKVNNEEIYNAMKSQVQNANDDDILTYFGESKDVVLKRLKPRRKEGLEYQVRAANIMVKYLPIKAKENLTTAQGRISAIGRNMDVADEVRKTMVDQTFKGAGMDVQGDIANTSYQEKQPDGTMKTVYGQSAPAGESSPVMKPIANYATPEQVQSIASKYNVPLDQLQPEMAQAKNRVDAQQLRQIDFDKSAGENIANIGGQGQGIGENTMKAIATTQTKGQQEASKIDAFNAGTNRIKAENDTKAENRKLLEIDNVNYDNNMSIRNSLVREMSYLQAQLKEANDEVNLDPPLGADDDQKKEWQKKHKTALGNQIKIVSEIESLQGNLENIDKKIGGYIKVDLSRKGYSAGTAEDVATFVTGRDPGETIDFTAQGLLNYGQNLEQKNGIQLGLNYEGMAQALKNGSNIAEIIYRIRKRAGLER